MMFEAWNLFMTDAMVFVETMIVFGIIAAGIFSAFQPWMKK